MYQGNWLAYIALVSWPLIALIFYWRLPIAQATLWTLWGGYLLLPHGTEIKIAMVPVFNKSSIPSLAALAGCLLFARHKLKFTRGFGLVEMLLIPILVGPFVTSLLNTDSFVDAGVVVPGVGAYDAGSAAISDFIVLLPFFIGRQYFQTAEDNLQIFRVMVIAGLAYSLPMLVEVRLSPQFSNWVYGFFPSSFIQELRNGGFRPVVFLRNGLTAAFFVMICVAASTALWRTRVRIGRLPAAGITGFLTVLLVLCKTASAFAYGLLVVPLIRWASPRLQLRVACVLVIFALSYPILRVVDLIPTESILNYARMVSENRAQSLQVRFTWERRLLNHALERPWFGWGRYGRSRVIDPDAGRDLARTDGYWVILIGTYGLIGFAGSFGLLGLSVFRAAGALKFLSNSQEGVWLASLGLIIAINIFDQLPNASILPWTWLFVGSLIGRTEAIYAAARRRSPKGNLEFAPVAAHETTKNST